MSPNLPLDPRAMFELFASYDEAVGLEALVGQIDCAAASKQLPCDGVPSQRDASDDIAQSKTFASASADFLDMVKSDDFQSGILPLVLNAYPEKKRLLFVHIPKCAGTDLRLHLERRFASFAAILAVGWRTPKEELYRGLRQLVLELRRSDTIFVYGHMRLGACVKTRIVRPCDRIVTVVREPEDIVVSHLNFVLSQITRANELGGPRPEAQRWAKILQEHQLSFDMLESDPQCFFKKMLRHMGRRNTICNALGKGDAKSALKNAQACDIEITTVENYNSWIRANWAVTDATTVNKSRKFLSKDMLDDGDIEYVKSITSEDRRVFDLISDTIRGAGTVSIRGRSLERALDRV